MRTVSFLACLMVGLGGTVSSAEDHCDFTELQKLLAGDGTAGEVLGISLAMEGDLAVVGLTGDDPGTELTGRALVFERDGEGCAWRRVAELVPSDGKDGDQFGRPLAISGNIIMVGAWNHNSHAGAAYVFEMPEPQGWGDMTETVKLTPHDAEAGDQFGSVALCGYTAVIGAPSDNDRGQFSGSAYVFERIDGVWTQIVKFYSPNPEVGAYFGLATAIQNDTILVGEPGGGQGARPGTAYTYEPCSGDWILSAILTASDAAATDSFGQVVDLSADASVALITAPTDDNAHGANAGAAYIFERPQDGWEDMNETHKLTNPDGQADEEFGLGAALDAGGALAVIGAFQRDDPGSESGGAFVFQHDGATWARTAQLVVTNLAAGDYFGLAVAVSNGTALIGAPRDDERAENAGAAYAFDVLPPTKGNMNCDCEVNALDIEPFLVALFDPTGYPSQYPDCQLENADTNCDGPVDALDIEPFIMLLFDPDEYRRLYPYCGSYDLTYQPVDFSAFFNSGPLYEGFPAGEVVLKGIPFSIPEQGPNTWWSYNDGGGGPGVRSIDIPVGVFGVREVHTLINTAWGTTDPELCPSLTFTASDGVTYTKLLIGNDDVRDYCQNRWTNEINGCTTTDVFNDPSAPGCAVRLDSQTIRLPRHFGARTLQWIRLSDPGNSDVSRSFLYGLTVGSP